MISILYRELFSIEFLNSFYSSGKCPDLHIVPSAECQRLLSALGLRFIPTVYGGKLFGKVDKAGPANNPEFILKNPVPENTRFLFFVKIINKGFETFSQTNLERNGNRYYYFNNLVNNTSADNFPLLVANTSTKKVSDADLIQVKSGTFSFTHTNPVPTQTGTIELTDTGEKLEHLSENNNDRFDFSFDLAKISQGRVSFSIEGNPMAGFYNLHASEGKDFFAIVEIFHRQALPGSYRFIENNDAVTSKNYRISFGNRSTRWRYLVTKRFNQGITAVSVQKNGSNPISFNPHEVLPGGQFSVASSAPIPLKEETVTGISLKDQTNKTIIGNLPNPAFTHLKKEGADLFSDILITI